MENATGVVGALGDLRVMLDTILLNVMGGKSLAVRPFSSLPSACVEGNGRVSFDDELGRRVPLCEGRRVGAEVMFCNGADLDLRGTLTWGLVAGRTLPLEPLARVRSVWRSFGGGGGPMVGLRLSVRFNGVGLVAEERSVTDKTFDREVDCEGGDGTVDSMAEDEKVRTLKDCGLSAGGGFTATARFCAVSLRDQNPVMSSASILLAALCLETFEEPFSPISPNPLRNDR